MKRTSILAMALLLIASGIAQARPVHGYGFGFGHSHNRYRTRWSIYAHGLISGDLYYSPYVTGHGSTRLVDSHVRYSPYAFGGGHSGLVADYGYGGSYGYGLAPVYYHVVHHTVPVQSGSQLSGTSVSHAQGSRIPAKGNYRGTAEQHEARRAALARARQERDAIRANDGKQIIAAYLKARNIEFKTTRTLSIAGGTVSVDFLLNDGKTILKYWNPAEIPSTAQQQQRERSVFDKYLESCEVYLAEHLRSGGNVHQIISSDRDEILAKLPQCPDLSGAGKAYAAARD